MKSTNQQAERPESSDARRGFTLIEILVVIVVIGILVGIGLQYAQRARDRAHEIQVANNARQVRDALEQFNTDHGGYPFRIKVYQGRSTVDNQAELVATSDLSASSGQIAMPNGLIGGRHFLREDGTVDLERSTDPGVTNGHKVINPRFGSGDSLDESKYQFFNQYSDPLLAMDYLPDYPRNPFVGEPTGFTSWAWQPDNQREPSNGINTVPGELVYTHFPDLAEDGTPRTYEEQGRTLLSAEGMRRSAVTYEPEGPLKDSGLVYKLDLVDDYILWGYGTLPTTGAGWRAYGDDPADSQEDLDGNGYRDTYERFAEGFTSVGNEGYQGGSEQPSSGGPEF